jgi:hypothetical protein
VVVVVAGIEKRSERKRDVSIYSRAKRVRIVMDGWMAGWMDGWMFGGGG